MRLMTWTVVDDGDMIQVRASINVKTEPREITFLIDALVKRAASPLATNPPTPEGGYGATKGDYP
jgi:hypothetical protein